ncbi:MAG: glycosyltransferase family 4 protein [Acidobacteriia bacterium]|nr:glycosyltransferase family 4 protein [Terriglobia bacterium]
MKRLLFITPNPIESASERYRIYQFLPELERVGYACTVRPFASPKLFRAIQNERLAPKLLLTPLSCLLRALDLALIPRYDAVVIHREAFPFFCPVVEKMVQWRHSKVIFSFDDAIYIGHRDTQKEKYPWIYKLKYGSGVNEVLAKSARVIAGNQKLAGYARRFNSRVSVIPTVVDTERYRYRPPATSGDCLTIGWVGSRSTSPYLLEIEPALRRLSEAYPGKIRFRLYGHPQRKLNLPNFESLPFSLATEVEDIRSLDIGIMPMPDNDWTRGKCAFKAIQYMALGIPVVTSPVGMATEVVQHNVNGLWARMPEDWFEALNHLVKDAHLRQRFAEEGRKTVESHYSLQVWAPRFVDLLDDVLTGNVPAVHRVTASAAD